MPTTKTTVQVVTQAEFSALVSTRSLEPGEVYIVDGQMRRATTTSAHQVVGGADSPLRVYSFGSSSTNYNIFSSGGDRGASNLGYMPNFLRRCGGAVRWVGNSGVSGETSVDQVARLPALLSAFDDSTRPTHFIMQVAANDSSNGSITVADTIANVTSMIQYVQRAGITPVLLLPTQRTLMTSAQIARQIAYVQWGLEQQYAWPGLRVANPARYLADTTSVAYGVQAGTMKADGLHLTARGAYLSGWALFDALRPDLPQGGYAATPGYLRDSVSNIDGNRMDNPFLVGSGGTGGAWVTAGQVPADWFVTRLGGTGTVAISKVARDDRPGEWTRFTFTQVAGDEYTIYGDTSTLSVANELIYAMFETRSDTSASNGGVRQLSARIRSAGAVTTLWEAHGNGASADENRIYTYPLQQEFRFVPAGVIDNVGASVYAGLHVRFDAAGTFVLDIGAVGLYPA